MRQSLLRYFGMFLSPKDGFLHGDDTQHGTLDARS
jgi:hypothetical protein